MKKLEIKITFEMPENSGILFLLRAIGYFSWSGIMQRAGGKIEHLVLDGSNLTLERICEVVMEKTNQPITEVSPSRKRELVEARQIAMALSRENINPHPSYAVISKYFGDKDHATALHACKIVNNLIDTDKNFRQKVENIRDALK
jgi:chromosomal replication initiation ATPase DnaA